MINPRNFEEKLVWYSIVGTYGITLLGAMYVWIPILAWLLVIYLGYKLWHQDADTPWPNRIVIPVSVWVWVVSMSLMEVAVIAAHIDFDLGAIKIASGSLAWTRSWALMALFPLAGCLNIRPQLVYRAVCHLCIQSIPVALLAYLASKANIFPTYLTPWWYVFRGDPMPYTVAPLGFPPSLSGIDNEFRLNLFTPYANSLGIVGAVFFLIALQESDKRWRWAGVLGSTIMVVGSFSRMTTLCLVIVPILTWLLTSFTWPVRLAGGVTAFLTGLFAPLLLDSWKTFYETTFTSFRQGSERVRKRLADIAIARWEKDAPIWGHGFIAERGPETVEGMPIGTHNQWPDLLYLKGVVGFLAFLIPLAWSFADLLVKAQYNKVAKLGLSLIILLVICTNGADIEAPTYLYWPGLLMLGMAFQPKEKFSVS